MKRKSITIPQEVKVTMEVLSGSQVIQSKTSYREEKENAVEMLSMVPSPSSTYSIFFFEVFDCES